MMLGVYWCMWFLFVTVIMLIKQAVKINQVVGDKIKWGHVLILRCFAMAIHIRQMLEHGEISHRQTEGAEGIKR